VLSVQRSSALSVELDVDSDPEPHDMTKKEKITKCRISEVPFYIEAQRHLIPIGLPQKTLNIKPSDHKAQKKSFKHLISDSISNENVMRADPTLAFTNRPNVHVPFFSSNLSNTSKDDERVDDSERNVEALC
jgi:hypothetical protein